MADSDRDKLATCPECQGTSVSYRVTCIVREEYHCHGGTIGDLIDGGHGEADDSEQLDADHDGADFVCDDCGYVSDEPDDFAACEHPDSEDGYCLLCAEPVGILAELS